MIAADLVELLCCPETQQPLAMAGPELVAEMNGRIAGGQLRNRVNQLVTANLDGGLIRRDGQYLYPIRESIPVLLIDEAIPLSV